MKIKFNNAVGVTAQSYLCGADNLAYVTSSCSGKESFVTSSCSGKESVVSSSCSGSEFHVSSSCSGGE